MTIDKKQCQAIEELVKATRQLVLVDIPIGTDFPIGPVQSALANFYRQFGHDSLSCGAVEHDN